MFYEDVKVSAASFIYYLGQDGIGQVVMLGKLQQDKLGKLQQDKLGQGDMGQSDM